VSLFEEEIQEQKSAKSNFTGRGGHVKKIKWRCYFPSAIDKPWSAGG
jgi:hypothetical protein